MDLFCLVQMNVKSMPEEDQDCVSFCDGRPSLYFLRYFLSLQLSLDIKIMRRMDQERFQAHIVHIVAEHLSRMQAAL